MSPQTVVDIFLAKFEDRYGEDFWEVLPNPGFAGEPDNDARAKRNFNPKVEAFLRELAMDQVKDVDTETEAATAILAAFAPLVHKKSTGFLTINNPVGAAWEADNNRSDIEQFESFKAMVLQPAFKDNWWVRGVKPSQTGDVSVESEGLSTSSGEVTETEETVTTESPFDPVKNPPKAMMRKIVVENPDGIGPGVEVPYGSYHGPTLGPNGEQRHIYRTYSGNFETWASDGAGGWQLITKEQKAPPEAESEYFDVSEKVYTAPNGNRHPIFRATGLPDLQRSLGPAFKAATTFKPVVTTMGDDRGYLDENNEWVSLGPNTKAITAYEQAVLNANETTAGLPYASMTVAQQATADQARRNADATRARDLMTAQQYDYQNQLGAAQEQRLRFQAAQDARQATAQLGLQAAQQTQQDFLTFNEILNNPQSALSSMNWMRGAVAPTEENRFGEDTPMNRLADFNKSRDMYNSYLSQMYSQPMPEMPAFNPAASTTAGFMGTSIQNIINQQQAENEAKIARQKQIIAERDKTIATNVAANADTNAITNAANVAPVIQPTGSFYTANTQPNFATATPDMRFNPVSELGYPTATTRDNAAIAARRAKALEAERIKKAQEAAMAGLAGIGFR